MKAVFAIGAAFAALGGLVAFAPAASAANIDLRFIETSSGGGAESLSVQWSSDPLASFTIAGTTDNWQVTLNNHEASGGAGQVLT